MVLFALCSDVVQDSGTGKVVLTCSAVSGSYQTSRAFDAM